MMAKRLAFVDVGNVHLDHRAIKGGQRIKNRDGCMRIGCGVDDDTCRCTARFLHPIDQLTFVVGLMKANRQPQILGQCRTRLGHVIQGLGPVNLGLTQAQKVQVRAVQNENGLWHGAILLSHAVRIAKMCAGTSRAE